VVIDTSLSSSTIWRTTIVYIYISQIVRSDGLLSDIVSNRIDRQASTQFHIYNPTLHTFGGRACRRREKSLFRTIQRVIRTPLTIQKSQQILDKADVVGEGAISDITRATLASSSVTFDQ
jgi:hypothetical protein